MGDCKHAERLLKYGQDYTGLKLTVAWAFDHAPDKALFKIMGRQVSAGIHCDTKSLIEALYGLLAELEAEDMDSHIQGVKDRFEEKHGEGSWDRD